MTISEGKIIRKLPANSNKSKEETLHEFLENLDNLLNENFGGNYVISNDSFKAPEKEWSHAIKIRKGNKVGVQLDFNWNKTSPDDLEIEITKSSKMGSQITYSIFIIFILIGAYMGAKDIEPLAFLPGYKVAAGLGGLIALIPGAIVIFFIKKIVLTKEDNNESYDLVRRSIDLLST